MLKSISQPPQVMKSNFNLSFNNSFNTSYNNQKPQMAIKSESMIDGAVVKHQFAMDLEEKLTARLQRGNDAQKLQAVT